MRTLLQSYNNVLRHKFLNASVLTGPSSGAVQLHETIVQPFCRPQRVELSQVRKFMNKKMDVCTVIGAACRLELFHGTRNTLKPTTRNTHKPTDCSKYCAHIHLYTHTLTNLRQFYTLGTRERMDDWFIQLCTRR